MSAQIPENNNNNIPVTNEQTMPVQPVAKEATNEPMQTEVAQDPATTNDVANEQQQAQEAQVIQEVAQAIDEEQVTPMDIFTAVLSDTLQISSSAAESLGKLLVEAAIVDRMEEQEIAPVEQKVNVENSTDNNIG